MTEISLYNQDGTTCGWLILTKQGFRWITNKHDDRAAMERLIRAIWGSD